MQDKLLNPHGILRNCHNENITLDRNMGKYLNLVVAVTARGDHAMLAWRV
jgi:hypothetical protein